MEPKFKFVGKTDPENVRMGMSYLNIKRLDGLSLVEGEYEKSEIGLELVKNVLSEVFTTVVKLGISNLPTITPDQIHLLTDDVFNRMFPQTPFVAKSNNEENSVYININKLNKTLIHETLVHECLHLLSATKFHLKNNSQPTLVKTGYRIVNPTSIDNEDHFEGLNEAVTEKITKEITGRLGIRTSIYDDYIEILDIIIDKIAEVKGEALEDVWKRFKVGMFTGNMMHLRDVEQIFGKGSLRVLAAIESGTDLPDEFVIPLFRKYFTTKEETTREIIAKQILNDRERIAYSKRENR